MQNADSWTHRRSRLAGYLFRRRRFALGAVTALVGVTGGLGAATVASGATAPAGDWTVYHLTPRGTGDDTQSVDLNALAPAWTSPTLDGKLYGEPLVFAGVVFVATENDTVYALSATTGKVQWQEHLSTPVPAGELPCGDISPTVGITSTPVIDTARQEVFVIADEQVKGAPRHELFGLDASTGAVMVKAKVDPPGALTTAILQRASLTLDEGNVVFGYGGNDGDCSTYHGWVGSVPETGGTPSFFEVDSAAGESQGAVWMGGAAPEVQSDGDIWVATGNGSVSSPGRPYDDSDGVLELSPALELLQFFAPGDWYADNGSDLDLGSSSPALLGNGLVVEAGKSQTAYLLDGAKLGGIGGQLHKIRPFCGNVVDGGTASHDGVAYLPCQSGVVAVATNAVKDTFRVKWQTSTGAGGPPIVAGGLVWTMSGGTLYGLDPATGDAVQQLSVGGAATDFPTPSVGDGLMFANSSDQVHAFSPGT